MAELKTKPTRRSVAGFISGIRDPVRRRECRTVAQLMRRATGARPRMWGPSIVGYGSYHYRYPSGREGDWFLTGFAPRAGALTVYIMAGFRAYPALMKKLGKHKTGAGCLYIRRLADVDVKVLDRIIRQSVKDVKKRYGG